MQRQPLKSPDEPAPGTRRLVLASTIRRSLFVSAGVFLAQPDFIEGVRASPQGGQIVAGQGNIVQPDARTTVVHQQTKAMMVDWQNFNLAK